jgi:hypothetical protein
MGRVFFLGDPREEDHFQDPSIGGVIILKRILKKWDGVLAGLIWLGIGTRGGLS